jgi:hypothetical protein
MVDVEFVEGSPPAGVSEEAPYGYKADGTPYKKRPPRRTGRGKGGRRRRPDPGTPEFEKEAARYKAMATECLSYPVTGLAVAGMTMDHAGHLGMAYAIGVQEDEIASAVGDIAVGEPKLAQVLERMTKHAPYVKLALALAPLAPQALTCYGVTRPGFMGTFDPEKVAPMVKAHFTAQMAGEFTTDWGVPSGDEDGAGGNGHVSG